MTHNAPARVTVTALPLALASALTLAACGPLDGPLDDGVDRGAAAPPATSEVGSKTQAYKHGTPPGPAPWRYTLSVYGGLDDTVEFGDTPACGGRVVDGKWYYATGAHTFGCGAKLKIVANGKCVVVKVVDNGPAAWVEAKAKDKCGHTGYMIDASPLVSKHLWGVTRAGWSECRFIEVSQVSASTPTGPCDPGATAPPSGGSTPPSNAGNGVDAWIGRECASGAQCATGRCLTGYPRGMCTKSCERLCPDRHGEPITFCVSDNTGGGLCHSRCDYNAHPQTGCRPGYRCRKVPRHNQGSVWRNACIPQEKADGVGTAPDAEGDLPNPEHTGGADAAAGCAAGDGHGDAGVALGALLLLGLVQLRRRR